MKNFKLFFYQTTKENEEIIENEYLFSSFSHEEESYQTLTKNEILEEFENDRYTLSFEVLENYGSVLPNINLFNILRTGRKLKLILNENQSDEKIILFIISEISPETNSDNTIFRITAEDYASYIFTRNNSDLEFDSFESDDFLKLDMEPNTYSIGNYLLDRGLLRSPIKKEDIIVGHRNQTIDSLADFVWSEDPVLHDGVLNFTGEDSLLVGTGDSIYETPRGNIHDSLESDGDYWVFPKFISHTPQSEYTVQSFDSLNNLYRIISFDSFRVSADSWFGIGYVWMQDNSGWGSSNNWKKVWTWVKINNSIETITFEFRFLKSAVNFRPALANPSFRAYFNLYRFNNYIQFPFNIEIQDYTYNFFIENDRVRYNYIKPHEEAEDIFDSFNMELEHQVQVINNNEYEAGWKITYNEYSDKLFQKLNISVSSSNTYSALVELANLTDSNIYFDYENKVINFIPKNNKRFFDKNYQISPSYNIQELIINTNISDLYTLLFVTGGVDELGRFITITPSTTPKIRNILIEGRKDEQEEEILITRDNLGTYYNDWYLEDSSWIDNFSDSEKEKVDNFIKVADKIPYLDNFIFNPTYFLDMGIIDENSFNDIFNRVYNDLRKINYKFIDLIFIKNTIEGLLSKIESEILAKSEIISNPNADEDDIGAAILEFNNLFKRGSSFSPGSQGSGFVSELINNINWGIEKNNSLNYNFITKFPVEVMINQDTAYLTNWSSRVIVGNSRYTVFLDTDDPWTGTTFTKETQITTTTTIYNWRRISNTGQSTTISALTEIELTTNYPASQHKGALAAVGFDPSNYDIYESQSRNITTTSWGSPTNVGYPEIELNKVTVEYTEISTPGEFSYEYKFFDLMNIYNGSDKVLEILQKYENRIKDFYINIEDYKKELFSLEINLQEEEAKQEPNQDKIISLEQQISTVKEEIELIELAIGNWEYDFEEMQVVKKDRVGFITLIYDKMTEVFQELEDNPNFDFKTENTILQRYWEINDEKKEFWFNLKKDYGHIFLEGYFENDYIIDSIELYNQSVLYAFKYEKPLEEYSTTILDISDLIGIDLKDIKVCDIIYIDTSNLSSILGNKKEIQISSIKRELKKKFDISLEIKKIDKLENILQKLLINIEK